jgi:rubrerythrin
MSSVEQQLEIVELLAQHELALAELYEAYAERFIENETLWYGLVTDEKKHAAWIRAVAPKVKEGAVIVNENTFPAETIQAGIAEVKNLATKARELDVSFIEALNIAMRQEKGLIDRNFYTAFEGDPDALKDLPKHLQEETQYHYKLVEEKFHQEQNKQAE